MQNQLLNSVKIKSVNKKIIIKEAKKFLTSLKLSHPEIIGAYIWYCNFVTHLSYNEPHLHRVVSYNMVITFVMFVTFSVSINIYILI